MSKAIEGAAMIGGAIGMGVIAMLQPEVLGSAMYEKVWASLIVGGIAMEAGAIADALTQNRGMGITTRQPAAFRQIIYGVQRVGGTIVYQSTTGGHLDQYNFIIVLAGHECSAIQNLYLDGRQVFWQGSGPGWSVRNGIGFGGNPDGANHIGPGGQHYNFGGLVYCEARFGDQPPGDVIGAVSGNDPNWVASGGNSPSLMGCTYVYLKVEYDPSMFPNLPEVRFTLQGKNNIWDPRTSTYGYTANWALVCADVITDPMFGLNDNSVNQAQLIAAANVCDEFVDLANGEQEARYQCHTHYDSSMDPDNVLETMLPAAAGRMSRIGGQWYLWPAYWQGPSYSFDQSALTGPIQGSQYRSIHDLVNRINGTYIAPNSPYNVAGNLYDGNGWYDGTIADQFPFAFQPTNYPQYAEDALHGYGYDVFLAQDSGATAYDASVTYGVGAAVTYSGALYQSLVASNTGNTPSSSPTDWAPWGGLQLPKQVVQNCVLSIAQAQRCAKILLLRNRQQGAWIFPMFLQAAQMQEMDVMQFTFPNNSWTNKQLEITDMDFHVDRQGDDDAPVISLQASVQETDESVYEWDAATEELSPYDVPANPPQLPYLITPPSGLTLASSALIGADGIVTPRILATWTAPGDARVTQIQVQYQFAGAGAWTNGDLVNVDQPSDYIIGVVAGQTYNVQIASVTAAGAMSVWVSATITVTAPNSLQSSYSINPQFPLTQPTATSIAVAATAATFGAATVNYAARTLTIPTPTTPTWYYVTIADPTQQGESGSPTLTATPSTATTLVGVMGNTYLGAILCLPAGGAVRFLAGGWPAPPTTQVGT